VSGGLPARRLRDFTANLRAKMKTLVPLQRTEANGTSPGSAQTLVLIASIIEASDDKFPLPIPR